jgi:hypothetical protein
MKFDGRERRRLAAHESAQIAGRAGAYSRDGTFGVTERGSPISIRGGPRGRAQHALPRRAPQSWR